MKTRFTKRLISTVLAATMITSVVSASYVTAQASSVGSAISDTLMSVVMNTVERNAVYYIGKAADSNTDSIISEVLNMTKSCLSNRQYSVNCQLINSCKEISADLSEVYNVVTSRTNEIEDYLQMINQSMAKNNLKYSQDVITDDIYAVYKEMIQDYQELLDAFVEYNSLPEDERDITRLNNAYKAVYNNYYSKDSSNTINKFHNDLNKLLASISDYDYTQKISDSTDVTDPKKWKKFGSDSDTYLDNLYTYLGTVTNFENNMYDGLVTGINYVTDAAYMYIQAYRYYAELETMFISSDCTLSESEIREETRYVWDNFNNEVLRLERGINQMCYPYQDKLNSYMRSYDTLINMKLKNYKETQTLQQLYQGYEGVNDNTEAFPYYTKMSDFYKFEADKVKEWQYVYQFKMINDTNDKVFAIRNSNQDKELANGADKELYEKTNPKLVAGDMIEYHFGKSDGTCFSLDFFNLAKGSYTPGNYSMITSGSDLAPIVSGKNYAYNNSENLVDNIKDELSLTYGAENVYLPDIATKAENLNEDTLDNGQFMLMNTPVTWNIGYIWYSSSTWENQDADITWLNASMPLSKDRLASYQVTVDSEDDIYDNSEVANSEIAVMYTADPKISFKSTELVNNGGNGDTIIKLNESTDVAVGKATVLESGELLTIKAKPDEGSTIKSIVLKDKDGNVLDTILGEDDDYTVSTQEILQFMSTDEDGYYEFNMPVPCQDVTLEVIYDKADTSLYQYNVNLENTKNSSGGYDALIQFANYDCVENKSFKNNEEVTIAVTPYNNKICTGIIIKDKNGNVIENIDVEDITDDGFKVRPTERKYRFTMPQEDIIVEAILKDGYTVSVVNDANSSYVFKNLNCFDFFGLTNDGVSWSKSEEITFEAGSTVTLDVSASKGNYISNIKVYDEYFELLDIVKTSGSRISFRMPEKNVTVSISSNADNIEMKKAEIDCGSGSYTYATFVDSSKNTRLNIKSNSYSAGDTVKFVVDFLIPEKITLTDSNGNEIDTQVTQLTQITDETLKNYQFAYSFVMPESYVKINIEGEEMLPKLTMNAEKVNLKLDETFDFDIITNDKYGIIEDLSTDLKWKSSNTEVATVDKNGVVTACSEGTATITVTSVKYPSFYAKTTVEVNRFKKDESGNFMIRDYSELCEMSSYINNGDEAYSKGNYVLANDIIISEDTVWTTPIGTVEHPFMGTFDGNGYTIKNLQLAVDSEFDYMGLFGVADNATIQNLNVDNGTYSVLNKYTSVGTICGYIKNGVITNCSVYDVLCTFSDYTGGVVGIAENSKIEKCISDLYMISETSGALGGICGKISDTSMSECSFTGTIKNYSAGVTKAIVGETQGECSITDCINSGKVNENL